QLSRQLRWLQLSLTANASDPAAGARRHLSGHLHVEPQPRSERRREQRRRRERHLSGPSKPEGGLYPARHPPCTRFPELRDIPAAVRPGKAAGPQQFRMGGPADRGLADRYDTQPHFGSALEYCRWEYALQSGDSRYRRRVSPTGQGRVAVETG